MGTSHRGERRVLWRALMAVALVVLAVPIAADAARGQMAIPPVDSPDACLGPGATINFNTTGWWAPGTFYYWGNYVTVLGNTPTGSKPIGTIEIKARDQTEFPPQDANGHVTLPTNAGGIYSWTLRQTFVPPPGGTPQPPYDQGPFSLPDKATTKWTCNPTLTANTTCLPPSGGSLTLTGQINRPNDRIDVGFDVDTGTVAQPISKIIPNVGNTGPAGEVNVTFVVASLTAGQHTFYSGKGSLDYPYFYWRADDRATFRNGTGVILPVPIAVPCPSAALLVTPGAFDFGSVDVGSSSGGAVFNVVNVGTLAAPIGGISIGGGQGAEFVLDGDGCSGTTLPANGGCAVTVHFAPAGAGARTATLTATSTNSASASSSLTGTGVQPPGLAISPATKDFGSVPVNGISDAATFSVTNTGTAPQTITSATLTGAQAGKFVADPDTCGAAAVPGGGTCTVKAAFRPTATGLRTAKLVVTSDAGASATATLRGTGQVGSLGFDPDPAEFGVVAVGTSSVTVTIKVTNTGGFGLTISATHVAGDFLLSSDSCTGQALGPGATCAVGVLFRPTDAGQRTGSLGLDNDFGTSTGALHGVGIFQAILKFTPAVAASGSLATVTGRSFPANTAITLQWQEAGLRPPFVVTTDSTGSFTVSFVLMVGTRLGTRHLEPAPDPGVLEEPRPVAPLLVQPQTFHPRGQAVRSGVFNPSIISR